MAWTAPVTWTISGLGKEVETVHEQIISARRPGRRMRRAISTRSRPPGFPSAIQAAMNDNLLTHQRIAEDWKILFVDVSNYVAALGSDASEALVKFWSHRAMAKIVLYIQPGHEVVFTRDRITVEGVPYDSVFAAVRATDRLCERDASDRGPRREVSG